jgi:hypothetical protein
MRSASFAQALSVIVRTQFARTKRAFKMQAIVELAAIILISGGLVIASEYPRRPSREQEEE